MLDNSDKQLDGIKKISPAELKKSRELVLSSIGEKCDEDLKETNNKGELNKKIDSFHNVAKKMDSLSLRNRFDESIPPKEKTKFKPEQVQKVKSLIGENDKKENIDLKVAKVDALQNQKKKKKKKVQNKKKSSVLIASPKKKNVKNNKIKAGKINKKKIKKKTEKRKTKKKSSVRKKTRIAKNIFIFPKQFFNSHLKNCWSSFKNSFFKAIKTGVMFFFVFFLVFVVVYLFWSSVVLSFGNDSQVLARATTIIPVPAVVSKQGVIFLEKYKKILKNGKREELNKKIARFFILNRLFKKHEVTNIPDLEKKLVFDREVNFAPFERIKKIKNTINKGDSFVKIAKKFGDVYQATITDENIQKFDFGEKVKNIKKGETSPIIITQKGFYLVHCFDKTENSLSLSYVFIPAVSLDKYLKEEMSEYSFWNLTKF